MSEARSQTTPYQPIESCGLIGNSRTAALVSRAGALDWLCLPRFDGPSLFAALLDAKLGGSFSIRPDEIVAVVLSHLAYGAILGASY